MSDPNTFLYYSVVAFISLAIGVIFGMSYEQNKQLKESTINSGLTTQQTSPTKGTSKENVMGVTSSMEKSFQELGLTKCKQCLVDMIDQSQLPTNWCSDGRIVEKKPEVDELNNCYCPQLPECVR